MYVCMCVYVCVRMNVYMYVCVCMYCVCVHTVRMHVLCVYEVHTQYMRSTHSKVALSYYACIV